jgi:hypothetical protein
MRCEELMGVRSQVGDVKHIILLIYTWAKLKPR